MRGIRLALGVLVLVTGSGSLADDATPGPQAQPPRPVAQQPAAPSQELLREKLAQRDSLQREIEELAQATGTPQTIVVRVQMMEVNLTQLRKLGMDFERNDPLGVGGYSQANAGAEPASGFERDANSETSPASDQQALRNFLSTLEQNGLAKTIADPTIVATSGRPASFIAGGEFPLPAAQGSASAVEYRRFGTELNVTAVPLGNNKVRLDVHPRVSDVDGANSIDGQKVPSLRVQECDTSCEMTFGETVRLSGLATKRTTSMRDEKGVTNRTEDVGLWVLVTAELVEPMEFDGAPFYQPAAVYTPPATLRGEARLGSRPATTR